MRLKIIAELGLILTAFIFGWLWLMPDHGNRTVSAKSGGEDIYRQHCATCHGADGRAKTARGKRKGATDLTKSTISTANGIKVITNGRERMPEFKDILAAAEIQQVMAYIRGFRNK